MMSFANRFAKPSWCLRYRENVDNLPGRDGTHPEL